MVIHHTAMATAEAALDRLCDPAAEVSAHYLVCERGRVTRMVEEADRAWHAGAGAWGAAGDVNSRSIGIELANSVGVPYSAPQMQALEGLLGGVMARWRIPPERVIGHSDCAPGRKTDPGPKFDWARLAWRGLAVAARIDGPCGSGAGSDAAFRDTMRRIGYAASDDADVLLAALRLRHRPWAEGCRDGTDMAIAADLARRFPVDRAVTNP